LVNGRVEKLHESAPLSSFVFLDIGVIFLVRDSLVTVYGPEAIVDDRYQKARREQNFIDYVVPYYM
jgi:hypothetical protein